VATDKMFQGNENVQNQRLHRLIAALVTKQSHPKRESTRKIASISLRLVADRLHPIGCTCPIACGLLAASGRI
jgi:hypothetical protein